MPCDHMTLIKIIISIFSVFGHMQHVCTVDVNLKSFDTNLYELVWACFSHKKRTVWNHRINHDMFIEQNSLFHIRFVVESVGTEDGRKVKKQSQSQIQNLTLMKENTYLFHWQESVYIDIYILYIQLYICICTYCIYNII